MGLIKKAFDFIVSPSHSRTMGLLAMMVLISAVSLTVVLSQQQQTLKQRAAETDCTALKTFVNKDPCKDTMFDSSCNYIKPQDGPTHTGDECVKESHPDQQCISTGGGFLGTWNAYRCSLIPSDLPLCGPDLELCGAASDERDGKWCLDSPRWSSIGAKKVTDKNRNLKEEVRCNAFAYDLIGGYCTLVNIGPYTDPNCSQRADAATLCKTFSGSCEECLSLKPDSSGALNPNPCSWNNNACGPAAGTGNSCPSTSTSADTCVARKGDCIPTEQCYGSGLPYTTSDCDGSSGYMCCVYSANPPPAAPAPAVPAPEAPAPATACTPAQIAACDDKKPCTTDTCSGSKCTNVNIAKGAGTCTSNGKASTCDGNGGCSPVVDDKKDGGSDNTADNATLTGDSVPSGATVTFAQGNKTIKTTTTPMNKFALPAGTYDITFSKSCYEPANNPSTLINAGDTGSAASILARLNPSAAANCSGSGAGAGAGVGTGTGAGTGTGTGTGTGNVTLVMALNDLDAPVLTPSGDITAELTLYSLKTNSVIAGAPKTQKFLRTSIPGKKYSANITFTNLAADEYFIIVRKDKMIAKSSFKVSNSGGTITVPTTTLVLGDITQDNNIDIADWNVWHGCWRKKITDKPSCAAADIAESGTVDQHDFNTLMKGWATWTAEGI